MPVEKICPALLPCNRNTVYDSQQVTVLELVGEVANKTDDVIDLVNELETGLTGKVSNQDMIDTYKLDQDANFTGTWFGLKPADYPIDYKSAINVKEYGAVGDGVTDDTQAFLDAIADAVNPLDRYENAMIIIPKGNYIIEGNGVFSSVATINNGGLRIVGDGPMNSILTLKPNATELSFYDNVDTPKHQFMEFEGLQFTSTDSTLAVAFKIFSSGWEQGFNFEKCWFRYFKDLMQLTGAVGNSEHSFNDCRINFIYEKVINFDNGQAVNIEFFGTDIETVFGDILYLGAGGGGSVKMFGGSLIMQNDVGDTDSHYVINNQAGGNVGTGNDDFTFYSVKTELRSEYSKLVNSPLSAGSLFATFVGCNLTTTTGGTREVVTINTNKIVNFEKCKIPTTYTYSISGGDQSQAFNGTINFKQCRVPFNISDYVTLSGNYGSVNVIDCVDINPLPTTNGAINTQMNWFNKAQGDAEVKIKAVLIKPRALSFPAVGVTPERTVTLPSGSIIKNIHVKKPAFGGSGSLYQLFVGNDDKTTIYGQSTQSAQLNEHRIDATDIFADVGDVANERVVRLWATGGNEPQSGGYAIVEYY